jgi:hypothetical protein
MDSENRILRGHYSQHQCMGAPPIERALRLEYRFRALVRERNLKSIRQVEFGSSARRISEPVLEEVRTWPDVLGGQVNHTGCSIPGRHHGRPKARDRSTCTAEAVAKDPVVLANTKVEYSKLVGS